MPYVDQNTRQELTDHSPKKAGELNYAITVLVDRYLKEKGVSYTNINEVIGVLECAKLELYRRIAVPYEEGKISENGDVYTV
jgi:hypothetical protein